MNPTRPLVVFAIAAVLAATPAMAQRAHLGVHAGYDVDLENAVLGGQAVVPISSTVAFYPSLDYHFVDAGNRVGMNLDLRLHNPLGGSPFYAGGGLNLMRSSVTGASSTDAGANIIAGFESSLGVTHPYIEVRGLLRERSSLMLVGGFNWTLR
jgi:hypothetical protein